MAIYIYIKHAHTHINYTRLCAGKINEPAILGVKNSLSYVAGEKTRVLNNQSRGRRSVIISYVIIIFYRRDRKLDAKYNNNTRATHTHTHIL